MQGNLTECLETLLSLEKQHRLGEDITATKICCNAIIETLYLAKEWKLLNEHILLLAKRRSQLKQVSLRAVVCHHLSCTSTPSFGLPQSAQPCTSMTLSLARLSCGNSDRRHATQAIQSFVRQSMAYIPQTPDKGTRIELIRTLQTVTEGKVTHALPHIHLLLLRCHCTLDMAPYATNHP